MDDILGEESDNESEGKGKEKPGKEEAEDEEELQRQPGAGQTAEGTVAHQALSMEQRLQTASTEASLPCGVPR